MSKIPWNMFQASRAHLIVGEIVRAGGPASLIDSTAALAVLRRLARKQKPVGNYAATVVKGGRLKEIATARLG